MIAMRGHVLAFALLAAPAAAADAPWTAAEEASLASAADVRETRWEAARPPGGTYDRIRVHRYRTAGPAKAALLYLPGTNMNGQVALADEDHNLWVFLARRGVEVYALDYRTAFPPSSGVSDLGFMANWTVDAFTEDVRAAASLARKESGRPKLFVAGFSRGAFLAYACAGVEPETIAGLVILDGPFKNHVTAPFDRAAEMAKLKASGGWGSDVAGPLGWDNRARLLGAAAANPSGAALDARFTSVGDQVSDLLYNAWGPGGLTNTRGQTKVQNVSRLLVGYDRWYPAIQNVEGRAIASVVDDPDTKVDDNWGKWTVPILYFGSTGMGADFLLNGIYSAAKSGSKDVTLNVLERYGHLDIVVGEKARADVFEPTLAWILERAR
ncbi:MAG TPA: alpha/beta fold hydrolase [Vicinamibacteria bacterium]|jgi:pimeloyl-ACP methyl ester carboxylesterase